MVGKDQISTQKPTEGVLRQFKEFLHQKELPKTEDIDFECLPEILFAFYPAAKPIKEEFYSVQTLKCMRSGLASHFRKEKGWDIMQDPAFVKANEIFKGISVDSKKHGKGVKQSTKTISDIDLEHLQQQNIFNIIYFFCHRRRENLYEMKQDTYKIMTEPDGSQHALQFIDKVDKNHGPKDTTQSNEGKMFPTGGRNCFLYHKNIIF